MTPILFDKTETVFTSNGIGRLVDCISCVVTEERNGIYECELQYPINGKWYMQMVENGGIIGVIHDDNHDIQPFDIYKATAPIDGVVTFYAHHISYRLNNIILQPFTASTAAGAIAAIQTNSVNTNPFTFSTDKVVTADFNLVHPASVRSVLFGEEGSFLDVFGTAEYKFDKFNVQMLLNRGTDTGVTVRYGKNMTEIEQTVDSSGVFNAVAPYWSDGIEYVYPDSIIVQPTTPITPLNPVPLDMSDRFEDKPSKQDLIDAAQRYLDLNSPWVRDENIKVDFLALWQSSEYADIASIQRVGLCDYVSIYYTEMGVVAEKGEIVKVVFDVLTERFTSMEIGQLSNSFVAIDSGISQSEKVTATALKRLTADVDGKVNKTGDTMSGGLTINNYFAVRRASGNAIAIDDMSADASSTPNADTNRIPIVFRDQNSVAMGSVRAIQQADGKNGLNLYGAKGGNSNYLMLTVDANGNFGVALNAQNAWRDALSAKGWKNSGNINSSSPGTITFTGTFRGMIVTSAAYASLMGVYLVFCNSSTSTPVVKTVASASNLTFTPGSNNGKIDISSNSTANTIAYLIALDGFDNASFS